MMMELCVYFFFFSSRRRHTRSKRDWSSDVCSSDLQVEIVADIRDTFSVLVNEEEQSRVVEQVARTVVDPSKVLTRSQPKRSEERRVGKEGRSGWSRER